jgi:hypothetical protein
MSPFQIQYSIKLSEASMFKFVLYEGVSKSFRTGRLERELQAICH